VSGTLFAGWRPDAAGRERLARLLTAILAARPAEAELPKPRRPDQWHITLSFVGHHVGDAATAGALEALAGVASRIPPHGIRIERLAHWTGPGAVVALPEDSNALQSLCDACSSALRAVGIQSLLATSQPHVTLAFLPRGIAEQAWLAAVDCARTSLRVDAFELLFNPGGRYETLAGWPLRGPPLPLPPRQGGPL
jgi:RNA 2',3'-cyclic 3'-phosphodiesterase